jgi:hypothetical protein
MRTMFVAVLILVVGLATGYSQTSRNTSFKPKDGFVPDSKTALTIGEAVLIPVYGEKQIDSERPFKATLQGDVWTVAGTLNCETPACHGGTAVVKISKTSGQIVFMTHYK